MEEQIKFIAAQEMSKLGAQKGGNARANVLSKEERSEIARNAVRKRWEKAGKLKIPDSPIAISSKKAEIIQLPSVPYSMFKGQLPLGNLVIECHVLNNLKRVIVQTEVVRIITGGAESGNLKRYLQRNPLIGNMLDTGPITFKIPGGNEAFGYEAILLIEICDKYLEADSKGLLKKSQDGLVRQASIIMRACAKVGIIALIDEATGFQKYRADQALRIKLQAFIAEDLQEWARQFPSEFWFELARLENITYSPRSRPLRWGKYIMTFVYDAIDKDVGKALREKNPNPQMGSNHHQWLQQYGKDRLHDQITKVITIMKLCNNMDDFRKKFDKVFSKALTQLNWDEAFTVEEKT